MPDREWHDLGEANDCACNVCNELRECLAWALEQCPQTGDVEMVRRCYDALERGTPKTEAAASQIKISVADPVVVNLCDIGCHVGAVRRVILGTRAVEFIAKDRDEAGALVWEQR
jgi:hypothetical protein